MQVNAVPQSPAAASCPTINWMSALASVMSMGTSIAKSCAPPMPPNPPTIVLPHGPRLKRGADSHVAFPPISPTTKWMTRLVNILALSRAASSVAKQSQRSVRHFRINAKEIRFCSAKSSFLHCRQYRGAADPSGIRRARRTVRNQSVSRWGRPAHRILDESSDTGQHGAARAAGHNLTKDRTHVLATHRRCHCGHQHAQKLPPANASDGARNGVSDRSETHGFYGGSYCVAANGACDQLDNQIHDHA